MATSRPRVLCVDDDPLLLGVLEQVLAEEFDVDAVEGGIAGLGMAARNPGYAVVLTDLQMPLLDGIRLLGRTKDLQPDASRVLLTGQADLQSAVRAVNEGALHSFLIKPCPPEEVREAVRRAADAHAARTKEREVLTATISGAVQTLVDLLALANPPAFARAQRITTEAERLYAINGLGDRWELEVAAMLSQIASVMLPIDLIDRLSRGQAMSDEERVLIDAIPERSAAMVAHIPRLEVVTDIIRHHMADFDGRGVQELDGLDLPVGSRVLRIAVDLDQLRSRGLGIAESAGLLHRRKGVYDPDLLRSLVRTSDADGDEIRDVSVDELVPGARLEVDLHDAGGALLIGRGVVLNDRLLALVRSRMPMGLAVERVLVSMA